jgi:flagellar motor protein MotB
MIDENEFSEHESESATWVALADLMTGLMAIFLVLCLVILTNQDRTRVLIIQSVEKAMKEQGIPVEIDPKTGDISIAESILFPYASAQLSPQGQYFLEQFIPVYSKVLFYDLSPEQLEQVSRIVVEGHGSRDHNTSADYAKNMTLSLNRANAVVQYVNNMSVFPAKLPFLQKLTPVGRGNIDAKDYDDASDRKVVFKFQFASELFNTTKEEVLEKRYTSKGTVPDGLLINQGATPIKGTMKFFRSPAGSVFCGFFTPSDGSFSSVRCYIDEQDGINYPSPPDNCVQRIAFTLWEEGENYIRCDVQDNVEKMIFAEWSNKNNILPYGQSITLNDITCLSENTGITCHNRDKYGFFVSRAKQVTF